MSHANLTTAEAATITELRARPSARGVSVLIATFAPLIIWILAVPLGGVHLDVKFGQGQPLQTITPANILVVAAIVSLLAWTLLAVLERVRASAASARRLWSILAGVVLVLSFAGPLTSAVGIGAKLTLLAMHAVVAAVLLVRFARAPSGAPSA